MKKLNFFAGVKNIEELKQLYKTLVKKYHPDVNKEQDTTKIMQEINAEYDDIFEVLKNGNQEENKNHAYSENGNFKDIISKLVLFDETIIIEIVGSWIWLSGKGTYQYKEQIKELGFQWSGKHKKWYYSGNDISFKKKSYHNKLSYNDIKNKYGSERVNNKNDMTKLA